jgi:hypothetical protein
MTVLCEAFLRAGLELAAGSPLRYLPQGRMAPPRSPGSPARPPGLAEEVAAVIHHDGPNAARMMAGMDPAGSVGPRTVVMGVDPAVPGGDRSVALPAAAGSAVGAKASPSDPSTTGEPRRRTPPKDRARTRGMDALPTMAGDPPTSSFRPVPKPGTRK